jgi:hypothetical protein
LKGFFKNAGKKFIQMIGDDNLNEFTDTNKK